MTRGCVWACLSIVSLSACGGSATAPSSAAPLSERVESDHFVFHYASGDRVDAEWQEAFHRWAVAQLGVEPSRRIDYNKYTSRVHMGQLTGRGNTNGYADVAALAVHTLWATDNHETVHVYAGAWGFPVALFVEGLAVAHQTDPPANDFVPRWSGTPLHDLARRFRARGELFTIASLAETDSFRAKDANITYPESGSFTRYLIDTQGLPAMRRLYGEMNSGASLAAVREAFQRVYGFSLNEAERRWMAFLGA